VLYIIIGASLSAKTTARRFITRQLGVSGIDSDTLRTMVNDLRPEVNVGHNVPVMTNYENMRETIKAFIHARSFFHEDYILEGDAINVEDIAYYVQEGRAKAVVVGYPHTTAEKRITQLNIVDHTHWSHHLDTDTFIRKMEEFITFSAYLQHEARTYDMPFIDISDNYSIDAIVTEIVAAFGLRQALTAQ